MQKPGIQFYKATGYRKYSVGVLELLVKSMKEGEYYTSEELPVSLSAYRGIRPGGFKSEYLRDFWMQGILLRRPAAKPYGHSLWEYALNLDHPKVSSLRKKYSPATKKPSTQFNRKSSQIALNLSQSPEGDKMAKVRKILKELPEGFQTVIIVL